eukprot:Sspe_Gene.33502::Locus_16355_Transcript_1_1_Confidence_1.000_Length_1598::g.33502::m.33502/K01487/E3.5.4.3, guaD; guanine deaminase
MRVYRGRFVDPSSDFGVVRFREDMAVGVDEEGVVVFVKYGDGKCVTSRGLSPDDVDEEIRRCKGTSREVVAAPPEFFCPGMVDIHQHAPQGGFTGTATDKPLMEWLQHYTFPAEAAMENVAQARDLYRKVVGRSLQNGTTTSVYFATIHVPASVALAEVCKELGQRAFVGKVSMDRHGGPGYVEESTEAAVRAAKEFVEAVRGLECSFVQPALCPRFMPTCSDELLQGLGKLRSEVDPHLLVTTHVAESRDEVKFCRDLAEEHNGEGRDYLVLHRCGLTSAPSVLAHGVHLNEDELRSMAGEGSSIAHCALSNLYFANAALMTRRVVELGVCVGLGTDIAGGYDPGMLNAIRHTVTTSLALHHGIDCYLLTNDPAEDRHPTDEDHVISYREAFWMATVGGARAVGLDDKIGRFRPGMSFDALLVDCTPGARVILSDNDTFEDIFQKWVNLCDDRSIKGAWVQGSRVVPLRT